MNNEYKPACSKKFNEAKDEGYVAACHVVYEICKYIRPSYYDIRGWLTINALIEDSPNAKEINDLLPLHFKKKGRSTQYIKKDIVELIEAIKNIKGGN